VRKKRDPITGFKERILSSELVTPEEVKVSVMYIVTTRLHCCFIKPEHYKYPM